MPLRWPKSFDPNEYRIVTALDGLDQLAFRLLVSPIVAPLERSLRASVTGHRFEDAGLTWASEGIAAGAQRRSKYGVAMHEAHPDQWLAVGDVKRHYPSVGTTLVELVLNMLRISTPRCRAVLEFVDSLGALPGKDSGLPIGPEPSAVLGTASLMPVDNAFADVPGYFRLADDVWAFAPTERGAADMLDRFGRQLATIGLEANEGKGRIVPPDEVGAVVSDEMIDHLTSGGSVSEQAALELIERGLDERRMNWIGFGFGTLKRHASLLGIPVLRDRPDLLCVHPEAVGKYLSVVVSKLDGDDLSLLIEVASTEHKDDQALAGRVRVAHALGRCRVDSASAAHLLDVAAAMSGSSSSRCERTSSSLRATASDRTFVGGNPSRLLSLRTISTCAVRSSIT